MILDRDTLKAIMGVVIGPDESREIFAFIDAEEKFRTEFCDMTMARMQMAAQLFVDTELTPDTRRQLERQLRQHEPKMAQLLERCIHWTRQSDGTCRVCGRKA